MDLSSFPGFQGYVAARYRRVSKRLPWDRWSRLKPRRQSPSILNLGMMLSTECNGSINLRSMVWPIAVITLADGLEALSGDRYVKAEPAIDSLLERYPTGSKAPAERPQLPAPRHRWWREVRAGRAFLENGARTIR